MKHPVILLLLVLFGLLAGCSTLKAEERVWGIVMFRSAPGDAHPDSSLRLWCGVNTADNREIILTVRVTKRVYDSLHPNDVARLSTRDSVWDFTTTDRFEY